MKFDRRALLKLAVGASQLALLDRLAPRRAYAASSDRPTKILSIYIQGGISHQEIWTPFSNDKVAQFIPPPMGGGTPLFYNAAMVGNYDGTADNTGQFSKVRGPIWWNPANPTDRSLNPASGGKQSFIADGYSWVSKGLGNAQAVFDKACLLHGVDQGTATHASGRIASLCGVAGGVFRAPGIAAVIANAMLAKFPDRPLPNVSIGSLTPLALSTAAHPLATAAGPVFIRSVEGLELGMSDHQQAAWNGLRTRTTEDFLDFAGDPTGKQSRLTRVDARLLKDIRKLRGLSTSGTDVALEQLYNAYQVASKTLALDVVAKLSATRGIERLPATIPWTNWRRFGYRVGYADGTEAAGWSPAFELTLKLLKSDLATAVSLWVPGTFDHHDPPAAPQQIPHLRGSFEIIGQLMLEMMMTPSPSQPGKSLLDETLVYVFSEFGRTLSTPFGGTDHHPATTAILVGGGVQGNRMIGGYDEATPNGRSPLGVPVDIIDIESSASHMSRRVPIAADVAATIYRIFGLEAGRDFFIPGGYGEIAGVVNYT